MVMMLSAFSLQSFPIAHAYSEAMIWLCRSFRTLANSFSFERVSASALVESNSLTKRLASCTSTLAVLNGMNLIFIKFFVRCTIAKDGIAKWRIFDGSIG